jgi:small GTP-binding protein
VVKTEAAGETLKAVRKQVTQIQDEVARQALLSRSREIESILSRGELLVVVFGTGSAGKTSLVNALIGRMVGKVGAPMGTTEAGETYSLKLKGLNRQILITDTPGILEAGVAGTEREQLARQLATEADLLLFVVDNDLRQSEYEPLRGLAEIGKRSLLVLNKTDLYSEDDKETILARLRQRVRGFIATMDVVAIAANPQPAQLENGESFQPDPDVMPLIRRLAAVLRAEGEDLVADNILLQSQRLGEEARRLIDSQRRRQAEKVVERFQWIGAGVIAVTPLPVVDLLATAAVNTQMVVEIGRIYGCELNMERGRELALSLGKTLASLGIVKGAIELLSTALKLNVATYLVGKAIQGVTAAYLTRIAGKSFIEYFRHDQDWGDGGITEVVQRQFQLNRKDEFVKAFVQQAIARVVKPLETQPAEQEQPNSPDE